VAQIKLWVHLPKHTTYLNPERKMNPENQSSQPDIEQKIKATFASAIAEIDTTKFDFSEDGLGYLEDAITATKAKLIAAFLQNEFSTKKMPVLSDLLFGLAEWAKNSPRYFEVEAQIKEAAYDALYQEEQYAESQSNP
jgi:hypothetical protein